MCLKHTVGLDVLFSQILPAVEDKAKAFSAAKAPKTAGHGSECYNRATLPNLPWLKGITEWRSFADFSL